MKHTFLLFAFLGVWLLNFAQTSSTDKLDLPGDNLNLYAVLKIFQESETLEGFEKKLNDEDNHINNLDLNGDNKIDYIEVVDNADGDLHNIALRVAVNKDQEQDVAVIMVQKNKDGNPEVQIIGDEDLYGKDYIVEPNYGDNNTAGKPNPGYIPPAATELNNEIVVQKTTPAQIASWQIIRYIYVPTYVAWHSPCAGATTPLTGAPGARSTGINIMVIIIIGITIISVITAVGGIIATLHGILITTGPVIERDLLTYKQDISVAIIEKLIQGPSSQKRVQNSLEKIFQKRHQEMINCLLLIKQEGQFIRSRLLNP